MSIPFMPLFVERYLADTTHLRTLEHGAYFKLILVYWQRGGALPDDDERLARITGLTARQWAKVRNVLVEFFDVSDGVWRHHRIDAEHAQAAGMIGAGSPDETKSERKRRQARDRKRRQRAGAGSEEASQTDGRSRSVPNSHASVPHGHASVPLDVTQNEGGIGGDSDPDSDLSSLRSERARAAPPARRTPEGDDRPATTDPPAANAEPSPPAKPKRARATRIPPDWAPTGDDRAFAVRKGVPPPKVDAIAEAFATYWQGAVKNATSPDWSMKWRTWVLKEVEREGSSHARQRGSGLRVVGGQSAGEPRNMQEAVAQRRAKRQRLEQGSGPGFDP